MTRPSTSVRLAASGFGRSARGGRIIATNAYRDLTRLALGHCRRFRGPELEDIAARALLERDYPPWVWGTVNTTLYARMEASVALRLAPRYVRSRVAHALRGGSSEPPGAELPSYSLLCPSRGRLQRFASFVKSVRRTSVRPDRLEIVCYVDDDDPSLPTYEDWFRRAPIRYPNLRCTLHVGPPMWTPGIWNFLAEHASGELLVMANDDQQYVDYGWDVALDEAAARCDEEFADRIYCLYFHAGQYALHAADFPIVTRAWYEALGYFSPPIFMHRHAGRWTVEVATRIERLRRIPGIFVEHLHYQDYLAPFDGTYRRHRIAGEPFRDEDLFEATAEQRARDADRLRAAIAGARPRPDVAVDFDEEPPFEVAFG